MHAVMEATKETIIVVTEVDYLVTNARPVCAVPRSGGQY